jgi:hypothetical protein
VSANPNYTPTPNRAHQRPSLPLHTARSHLAHFRARPFATRPPYASKPPHPSYSPALAIVRLPHLATTLHRLLSASPSAIACISHTVRGDDLRWVLEAFSPYFECRDVTDAGAETVCHPPPVAAGFDAAAREKRPAADAIPVTSRDTRILILSLRPPGSAGCGNGGDVAGPDPAELVAMAKFEAARVRLGLKLP